MMDRNGTLAGNLACFTAYAIFGFNLISCRNIATDGNITPMALFCLRAFGAAVLFWIWSLFTAPNDKIEKKDLWKVAVASFLGLFLTQISFLFAIAECTAIDASILVTLSPMMTLVISAIVIKERITWSGIAGIALSLTGVLILIFNCVSIRSGANSTSVRGILGMIINTLSFASYLGIFKPLIQKYKVVTFMKWMFLFSSLMALPFAFSAFGASNFSAVTTEMALQVLFVVVGATFIAYFLIPFGQKRLRPVVVCMYTYVQPVIAMVIALSLGLDSLSLLKIIATVLVFSGVGLVNVVPKKTGRRAS
ncbi:MAG: EamA family transporter [Bacteroidales bacterium]|nr:EamA family transporter [Bacteroidales bacterium]